MLLEMNKLTNKTKQGWKRLTKNNKQPRKDFRCDVGDAIDH